MKSLLMSCAVAATGSLTSGPVPVSVEYLACSGVDFSAMFIGATIGPHVRIDR